MFDINIQSKLDCFSLVITLVLENLCATVTDIVAASSRLALSNSYFQSAFSVLRNELNDNQ
jgi:hypothetical protein